MLLDTDGPTLGVRFGMTGGLVSTGTRRSIACSTARGLRGPVGAGPDLFEDGGSSSFTTRAASARSSWPPTRAGSVPMP